MRTTGILTLALLILIMPLASAMPQDIVQTYNQTWLHFDEASCVRMDRLVLEPSRYQYDMAISTWMRPQTTNVTRTIFSKVTDDGIGYKLTLDKKGTLRMLVMNGKITELVVANSLSPEWHNVIISMNGTSVTAYLDGSRTGSVTPPSMPDARTATFIIGSCQPGGIIGDLRSITVFNHSITPGAAVGLFQEHASGDEGVFVPALLFGTVANSKERPTNEYEFRQKILILKQLGYTTISDEDFAAWQNSKPELKKTTILWKLPQKPIMLFFNFAGTDRLSIAAPTLEAQGYHGIIGIGTNNVGMSGSLNWTQLRDLREKYKWSVASHSASQCDYTGKVSWSTGNVTACNSSADIMSNLTTSFDDIERNTGQQPISFIHPYGAASEDSLRRCQQIYTLCFGGVYRPAQITFLQKDTSANQLTRTEVDKTSLQEFTDALNFTAPAPLARWDFTQGNDTAVADRTGKFSMSIVGGMWQNDGQLVTLSEATALREGDYTWKDGQPVLTAAPARPLIVSTIEVPTICTNPVALARYHPVLAALALLVLIIAVRVAYVGYRRNATNKRKTHMHYALAVVMVIALVVMWYLLHTKILC